MLCLPYNDFGERGCMHVSIPMVPIFSMVFKYRGNPFYKGISGNIKDVRVRTFGVWTLSDRLKCSVADNANEW